MTSVTLIGGSENVISGYLFQTSTAGLLPGETSPTATLSPTQRIAPRTIGGHHHQQRFDQHSELLRCKRRIQLGGHLGGKGPQPAAVARRNERERNRVRLVNMGFATLRQHVPNPSRNKKMSKVDTLRSAVEYIKRLQELLGEAAGEEVEGARGGVTMDENAYPGGTVPRSPTPSLYSEASSPYDVLEEDELVDFTSWF